MEGLPQEERLSLVERKRQEAFTTVLDELEGRLTEDIGSTFESNGREYPLTSAEDSMLASAQSLQREVRSLYTEIVARNEYYEEEAIAKLLELCDAYEKLVVLYTELRSNYPRAAARIESHVPSLTQIAAHGEAVWEEIRTNEQ